jgi:hypothetical protein
MDVPPRDPHRISPVGADIPSAPDVSLLPTTVLQPDVSLLHTTLLPPSSAQPSLPVMRDLEQKIALHEQAARRFREQADKLTDQVKHNAEAFAAVVARWRALTHQSTRTFTEAHELALLERSIPTLSQHIARIRRQWTDCVAAAREQEDAAEQLRAQLYE